MEPFETKLVQDMTDKELMMFALAKILDQMPDGKFIVGEIMERLGKDKKG